MVLNQECPPKDSCIHRLVFGCAIGRWNKSLRGYLIGLILNPLTQPSLPLPRDEWLCATTCFLPLRSRNQVMWPLMETATVGQSKPFFHQVGLFWYCISNQKLLYLQSQSHLTHWDGGYTATNVLFHFPLLSFPRVSQLLPHANSVGKE